MEPINKNDLKNIQLRALVSDADVVNASIRPRLNAREKDEAFHGVELGELHEITARGKGGKTEKVAKEFFRQMRQMRL